MRIGKLATTVVEAWQLVLLWQAGNECCGRLATSVVVASWQRVLWKAGNGCCGKHASRKIIHIKRCSVMFIDIFMSFYLAIE